MNYTLPKWYDLHVHFRQGEAIGDYIRAHLDMGCAGALAMPNTKPPVAKVFEADDGDCWSIEGYRDQLMKAGANAFEHLLTPLYLTKDTDASMIASGAEKRLLQCAKYYPPHGTTNADHGYPLQKFMENGVFEAMQDNGVILNIHGEEHGLSGEQYFGQNSNAEDTFYSTHMVELREKFPKLKIVCEHITTKTAADFVARSGDNIGATITPQHLLYTVADLLQGLKYHLYCLPLVKFEEDRKSLLSSALSENNTQFFAGTDSAPHTEKATECGCAAGCFTGLIAPQLYAQAFDLNDSNLNAFKSFLCLNGANFYDLNVPKETFTLEKKPSQVTALETSVGSVTPLSLGLGQDTLDWTIKV